MKRIIIALGGNAIQTGENTAIAQQMAIRETVRRLKPLISGNYELVITHGNGPQVGQLLLQQKAADSSRTPALPLNTCVAMTQGMIANWIQHEITGFIEELGLDKKVVSLISQVEVDASDPAFSNPTKPVGPFYTKEEAEILSRENPGYTFKEDAGRGIRRVVASPQPLNISNFNIIKHLIKQGNIVIAAGGGGIPVAHCEEEDQLLDAVIDKDLASAKLAELIDADTLIILTGVDNVYVNYNKPNQRKLEKVTVSEMEKYAAEGYFAAGSMLPKVEACCKFVHDNPEGTAIISSLQNLSQVLYSGDGTVIHSDPIENVNDNVS